MNKFVMAALMGLLSTVALAENDAPMRASETVTLTKDNAIILDQVIDEESTAKTVQKALELDSKLKSSDTIYLVMDTPGGSIEDGLRMITALKALNRPITTLTIFSASMGFQTVQGLGDRLITPTGTLMAHKARGGFSGEFPGQLDSRYVYYLTRLNEMDKVTASRSGGKLTVKSLQARYENEWWVQGQNAVDSGVADKVVLAKCDQSLGGTRSTVINFYGFVITLVQSSCPMNSGILSIDVQIATNQGLLNLTDFLNRGGTLTKTQSTTNDYYNQYDYFGPNPVGVKPVPPVATVEGLTMDKINAEIQKIRSDYNKRRQVVVKE